jgi:hypothetical protein
MSTNKVLFADTVPSTILQFTNAVPQRQLLWRVSEAGSLKHSCSDSCININAANYESLHSKRELVSYLVNTRKRLSLNCTYSPKRSGKINNFVHNLHNGPEKMCRHQWYFWYSDVRTLSRFLKTSASPRQGCSVLRIGWGPTAFSEFNFGCPHWALWRLCYLESLP